MLGSRNIGLLIIIIATQATHLWAFLNTVQVYNHNSTVEHILRKNIFKNYDKVVKPYAPQFYNSLEVSMKMLVKSAELNYEKSQMILSTWFIANWIDDRLTWNPNEYENLNSMIVDHREIWHPDIMAFNNVDANMEDDRTRVNSVLNSSGGVIWVEPVQYIIHCKTDTTDWPHDTQTGVLKLGSWLYLGRDLNLTIDEDDEADNDKGLDCTYVGLKCNKRPPRNIQLHARGTRIIGVSCIPVSGGQAPNLFVIEDICSFIFELSQSRWEEMVNLHSEWDITNISRKRNIRYYECCPDEQYIDIEYNITIRRNVHPYKSVLYIPALCSISFNLLTFWLPYSDNQSKLFVNLLNALFVTLAIMIVYTKVPIVTSTVPLIVVYYTYSLGLIAATAVLSMAVKGMSVVSKPLPHGVTWFLHSGYLVYFGIEMNGSTADCHMLCESEEMIAQAADLNDRQKLAKVIDRICFVVFAFIYLILLLRLMP